MGLGWMQAGKVHVEVAVFVGRTQEGEPLPGLNLTYTLERVAKLSYGKTRHGHKSMRILLTNDRSSLYSGSQVRLQTEASEATEFNEKI